MKNYTGFNHSDVKLKFFHSFLSLKFADTNRTDGSIL